MCSIAAIIQHANVLKYFRNLFPHSGFRIRSRPEGKGMSIHLWMTVFIIV